MKLFLNILIIFNICNSLYAIDDNRIDCLVLKDENSIICKYVQKRISHNKSIQFDWIEPDGTISRTKIMKIPAGHGSIYDYRYIYGRTAGTWTCKITDLNKTYSTTFTIEKQ